MYSGTTVSSGRLFYRPHPMPTCHYVAVKCTDSGRVALLAILEFEITFAKPSTPKTISSGQSDFTEQGQRSIGFAGTPQACKPDLAGVWAGAAASPASHRYVDLPVSTTMKGFLKSSIFPVLPMALRVSSNLIHNVAASGSLTSSTFGRPASRAMFSSL